MNKGHLNIQKIKNNTSIYKSANVSDLFLFYEEFNIEIKKQRKTKFNKQILNQSTNA